MIVLAPMLVGGDPASAVPAPPQHKVEVSKTTENKTDFRRRVGACTIQDAGGTCTISSVSTVSTTISVGGGVSAGFIAGQIGFSTTKTSSASASCTSPKLKRNDRWSAFPIGTGKYYTIWNKVGGKWVQQGGIYYAWQPHTYPDIWCGIY
jgi:hypothetical protein